MKILALYDIHGNPDALDAVLGDPRAEGADVVVVGGDAVPGARAREALDRLNGLAVPVQWVLGNGEREVAAAVAGLSGLGSDAEDLAASTAAVTAAELGAARRELGGLPLTQTIDGVLFCHASPRRDDEMLTRLSPPERWAKALAGIGAAVVVGGHTHQQDDRVVGGIRFINAGSVGLPYEGDGDARWLWIETGVPQLRFTAPSCRARRGERNRSAPPDAGRSPSPRQRPQRGAGRRRPRAASSARHRVSDAPCDADNGTRTRWRLHRPASSEHRTGRHRQGSPHLQPTLPSRPPPVTWRWPQRRCGGHLATWPLRRAKAAESSDHVT